MFVALVCSVPLGKRWNGKRSTSLWDSYHSFSTKTWGWEDHHSLRLSKPL